MSFQIIRGLIKSALILSSVLTGLLVGIAPVKAQLNENCTVSVFNRTVQVKPDGSWVLPNVPANMGQVRARATCIENGATRSGQSDFFVIPVNGSVDIPEIILGALAPIPESLTLSSPTTVLNAIGATTPLTVTATFPAGSTVDVTAGSNGTNYTSTNPNIMTVDPNGLVTAASSGTAMISAMNEGALGFRRLSVVLTGDSDGDGIPDDIELAKGLNPNNPVDGLEDFDGDGLTNKEELVDFGTDINNADTDGDGINDGEEIVAGADGFITNPLLADTDGDGIRDALEIATGSNPIDPSSFNLAAALSSIDVSPPSFVLTVNTIIGEASRQLAVIGNLSDGTTIDLTSTAKGTNYNSSNLTICNFGADPGRVFAGNDGTCAVTATNNGFSDAANAVVRTFAPTPLSFVNLPSFVNNVDVSGDYAYVAAGTTGLQVVDVSDRTAPVIVGSFNTPGNANDVKLVENTAFVADGVSGLLIFDVTTPMTPALIGTVNTPGNATDVVIRGTQAFVADGSSGLQVIDISNLASPSIIGSINTLGSGFGVDVNGSLAAVADGSIGLQLVDISDPTLPVPLGRIDTGTAKDVVLSSDATFAFVADRSGSFTSVDISNPLLPVITGRTPRNTGGLLEDVALAGQFAFGADVFFVNGVPIIDVSIPGSPTPRAILDFRGFRDDNGMGIAVDSSHIYLAANRGSSGRLYIGQYLALADTAGIPPTVNMTSPAFGDDVVEGSTLPVSVAATDDIAVVGVDLFVDGAFFSTDTTAPYQFNVPVPLGVTELTLGATAIDLGSNIGNAAEVMVNVIPDPLTTVTGRVVDTTGNPVIGATVKTVNNLNNTSSIDGRFAITNVPTILGDLKASAEVTIAGKQFRGTSASIAPVLGGTTDLGDIVVVSKVRVVINFDAGRGFPFSYSESGLTVTSRYPGRGHLHFDLFGGDIWIHRGCCSTPYEFTFGGRAFNVISFDVLMRSGTDTITSSSGAVEVLTSIGTHTFPTAGWENITSFRWHGRGRTSIDNLVIEVEAP